MAVSNKPNVLIMDHSFVRRFYTFLTSETDLRCEQDLGLGSTWCIRFFGIGGRTISKTRSFDCVAVKSFEPDVVILELGSNDLTPKDVRPETVGSDLADLVAHLFKVTNAKQIFVCQVLHREQLPRRSYNLDVDKLNKYLKAVISDIPNARYWRHRGMLLPSQEVLAADGVHLNDHGQYLLYRSYRGAVIQSLKSLGLA